MAGWVKVYRQIEENKLWLSEPFTKAQAWLDLIIFANHKDGVFWVRGIEVEVKRGQIGWSEVTMSKRWRWGRNKVRRFLKWLETEQQIEQQKTRVTSLVTILNYDQYQSEVEQQVEQQKDNRRNTNKNVKNDKNINININGHDHGNELVNFCITEFKRHYGFEPTDKYPRKVAWNLIQKISTILKKRGDEINDDYLKEKIGVYMNWYAAHESYQNTEKLETVKLKLSKFVSG
jgi:hypothetical protein